MSSREYGQYCAVAKALDAVGDRWTLLVVRELLRGPRRYSDLMGGLPGISTDMLATRLRELEAAGLVSRRSLPPPAGSRTYELTPAGLDLRPVLVELARFGTRFLGTWDTAQAFQGQWLEWPLHTMFRPERAEGVELTVQFNVDGATLHTLIGNGSIETRAGVAEDPNIVITAPMAALAEIFRGEPTPASVRTAGDPDDIKRLRHVLGLG